MEGCPGDHGGVENETSLLAFQEALPGVPLFPDQPLHRFTLLKATEFLSLKRLMLGKESMEYLGGTRAGSWESQIPGSVLALTFCSFLDKPLDSLLPYEHGEQNHWFI